MKKILISISLLIGILTALQVRSFKKIEGLLVRSEPANIFAELRVFQSANALLREQIEKREEQLTALSSTLANAAVEEEIKRLRLLAGTEPVKGQGIEITFSGVVEEFWITDLIAQLVSESAEAVALNDVRLTVRSGGMRMVGGGLVVGRNFLRSPIRITVIGEKERLQKVLTQSGGIIERIKNTHPAIDVGVSGREILIIPGLKE